MASCQGGDACMAINCSSTRQKRPNLSFFRFPKDPERCRRWVINTRRADLDKKTTLFLNKNSRLCADHFELSQFMYAQTKNRLIWNAIPTIFSVPNPPKPVDCKRKLPTRHEIPPKRIRKKKSLGASNNIEQSEVVQNAAKSDELPTQNPTAVELPTQNPTTVEVTVKVIHAESSENRSKLYRLKRKYEELEKKLKKDALTIDELMKKTKSLLPPAQHLFFTTQLKLASEGKTWKTWSNNETQLALNIYYASPTAYNVLKQLFGLPSVRCLQRYLEEIDLKPGLNEAAFEALSVKFAGLPVHKRLCSIVIDETSLKGGLTFHPTEDYVEGFEDLGTSGKTSYIADHASVISVRGLTLKWKQAVGYFTVNASLNRSIQTDTIKETVSRLEGIGLIVKSIVCDQGSNNKGMFEDLGIKSDHTFFESEDSKSKVYGIFDPPHLLKCTRNILLNQDIIANGFPVKWLYIKDFYDLDSALPTKAAHKLTDKHFNLTTSSKMRVNLASQIFSASVGAGMLKLIALRKLPPEAVHTANFVIRMDQLFDTLNSRLCFADNKFRSALSSNSEHINFLNDIMKWIQNWKVKSGKNIPTFKNWIVTIQSVIELWEDVSQSCNVKFLLTARLNQDCLQNLFSVVRKSGGRAAKPTPNQFRAQLKAVMISSMMTPAKTENCEVDINKFLVELCELKDSQAKKCRKEKVIDPATEKSLNAFIATFVESLKSFDLPENNILSYVAGYMSKEILKNHNCAVCTDKLQSCSPTVTKGHEILTMPEVQTAVNAKDFGELKTPTDDFLECISHCEKHFLVVFDDFVSRKNLHKILVTYIQNKVDLKSLGVCKGTVTTFLNCFVRCRIFWAIQSMNRKISEHLMTQKNNRKLVRIEHL